MVSFFRVLISVWTLAALTEAWSLTEHKLRGMSVNRECEGPPLIKVFEGDKVLLPCRYSHDIEHDVQLFDWQLGITNVASVDKDRRLVSFMGGFNFKPIHGKNFYDLEVGAAYQNVSGCYICRLYKINVGIIHEERWKLVVVHEPKMELVVHPETITIDELPTLVHLNCSAIEIKPLPELSWYRNTGEGWKGLGSVEIHTFDFDQTNLVATLNLNVTSAEDEQLSCLAKIGDDVQIRRIVNVAYPLVIREFWVVEAGYHHIIVSWTPHYNVNTTEARFHVIYINVIEDTSHTADCSISTTCRIESLPSSSTFLLQVVGHAGKFESRSSVRIFASTNVLDTSLDESATSSDLEYDDITTEGIGLPKNLDEAKNFSVQRKVPSSIKNDAANSTNVWTLIEATAFTLAGALIFCICIYFAWQYRNFILHILVSSAENLLSSSECWQRTS